MVAEFRRTKPRAFLYLRTRPEEGGSVEAMVDDGFPEWFSEPPGGFMAGHGEDLAGRGVGEVVVDDAVVRRVKAGDDGVVVGESERREDRDEAGFSFSAIRDQTMDV